MAAASEKVNLEFVNIPMAAAGAPGAAPPAPSASASAASAAPALASPPGAPAPAGGGSAAGGGAAACALDRSFTLFSLLSPSFWLAAFAVDTAEVVSRVRAAAWPVRRPALFLAQIAGKPDLYVPLWGPAVLVFALHLASNLASYLHFASSPAEPIWRSDVSRLLSAAAVVYGFTVGAPAGAWLAGGFFGAPGLGPVSLLCLYGYSVAVFVPAAAVCVLPSPALQWVAVLGATALSTFFVLANAAAALLDGAGGLPLAPAARTLLLALAAAHIAFGVTLKLLFFSFSS